MYRSIAWILIPIGTLVLFFGLVIDQFGTITQNAQMAQWGIPIAGGGAAIVFSGFLIRVVEVMLFHTRAFLLILSAMAGGIMCLRLFAEDLLITLPAPVGIWFMSAFVAIDAGGNVVLWSICGVTLFGAIMVQPIEE